MLIQRAGVNGVAAITVVNYLLVLGFMMFFAISDTIQVMISQNFGAAKMTYPRIPENRVLAHFIGEWDFYYCIAHVERAAHFAIRG